MFYIFFFFFCFFFISINIYIFFFFFSSRRRHTRFSRDWSSDVCSSDLPGSVGEAWREFFDGYRPRVASAAPDGEGASGAPAAPPDGQAQEAPAGKPAATGQPAAGAGPDADAGPGDEAEVTPLRGAAAVIAERMEESLDVPTATSVRTVPAKLLELNRSILNRH